MKYEKIENDTYNLYTIVTKKFKGIHMEVIFRKEASLENITYMSILANILTENSKEYPSKKLLTRHTYDLYNASVYANTTRVGNMILMHVVLDVVDPKYTSKEMLDEAIKLPFEMILNPNSTDSAFDEETFERIKLRVKNEIIALKENPKQASILSALKFLDDTSVRSFNTTGDLDVLETITPKKLYKYYQDFIENAYRDVYIIGDIDTKEMEKIVDKYAKFNSIPSMNIEIPLEPISVRNTKDGEEQGKISQTQLVGVYALPELSDFEREYVLPLFNMLWGSGSLESKLYQALREENSLCYNVSTLYQKYDKTIILHTAIDNDSVKLAWKLIDRTLNELKNGDFTDGDLENVKNLMITSLNFTQDSFGRLIDLYLFKNILGLPDIEDRIDEVKKVTRKDIMEVSKKLKLAMSYVVRGE